MTTRIHLFWSFARNLGIRLGSVVVFIILARILPPEQLGIFAVILTIIAFLEIISDFGLSDAVVQSRFSSQKLYNTALLINACLGLFLATTVFFSASYIAESIKIEGHDELLQLAVIGLVLNSLSFIPQSVLRKRFDFKFLAIRSFLAAILSACVGISLALLGAGVLALAGQFLTLSLVNIVTIWWKRPFYPQVTYSKFYAHKLYSFGIPTFINKSLHFFSTRAIELFIASFFGPIYIALYVMGNKIVSLAQQLIAAVAVDVYLPKFSSLYKSKDLQGVHNNLYIATEVTAFIGFAIFIFFAVISDEIISFVYGTNGNGAEFPLMLMAILAAFQSFSIFLGTVVNAAGHPSLVLKFQIIRLIIIAIAIYNFKQDTFADFMYAYVISWAITLPLLMLVSSKTIGFSKLKYLKSFVPYLFSAMLAFWILTEVKPNLSHTPVFITIIICGLIYFAVYISVLFGLNKFTTPPAISLLRNTIKNNSKANL